MSVARQLADVRAALEDAGAQVARLGSGASDDHWMRRPPGGGWSAAECITHLTMTNVEYMPMLNAARASVPAGTPQPSRFGRGFGGGLLEWILEPPARMRSKTIPAFVPGAAAPRTETLAAFAASQAALLAWISDAGGIALNRAIMTSPFNARLTYNAYAALRIIAAHQRRHLWQAVRALRGVP